MQRGKVFGGYGDVARGIVAVFARALASVVIVIAFAVAGYVHFPLLQGIVGKPLLFQKALEHGKVFLVGFKRGGIILPPCFHAHAPCAECGVVLRFG